MQRSRSILGLAVLTLWLWATPGLARVAAQAPPLPHAFYGAVEAAGNPAPVGTQIEARATGVRVGVPGNPAFVVSAGAYGGAGLLEPKLLVQGDIPPTAELEFYVNGVRAECAEPNGAWRATYPYRSGGLTRLNLRISAPTAGGDLPTATPTHTPTPTPPPFPTDPPTMTATPFPTMPTEEPPPSVVTELGPTSAPVSPLAAAGPPTPTPEVTPSTPLSAAPVVLATAAPTPTPTLTAPPTATFTPSPLELLPTAPSMPTPALVARNVSGTSRPILAPQTPSPVPPPATSEPPRGQAVALWGGSAALALAIGLGIIALRRLLG